MWNDKETDLDLLDFQHLTAGLLSIINDGSLLPATIGVFGDWGSGKSSLLKMVHNELDKEKDVLCISFNGWLFEGYDDAKAALLETIVKEISDKKPEWTSKRLPKQIITQGFLNEKQYEIAHKCDGFHTARDIAEEVGLPEAKIQVKFENFKKFKFLKSIKIKKKE